MSVMHFDESPLAKYMIRIAYLQPIHISLDLPSPLIPSTQNLSLINLNNLNISRRLDFQKPLEAIRAQIARGEDVLETVRDLMYEFVLRDILPYSNQVCDGRSHRVHTFCMHLWLGERTGCRESEQRA
jgi:hypothetical protein